MAEVAPEWLMQFLSSGQGQAMSPPAAPTEVPNLQRPAAVTNRTPGDALLELLTGIPGRAALEQRGTTLAGLAAGGPQSEDEQALGALAENFGLDLMQRPDLGVHFRAAQAAVPRSQRVLGPFGPTAIRGAGVGKEMLDQLSFMLGRSDQGFDPADLAANELGIQSASPLSMPSLGELLMMIAGMAKTTASPPAQKKKKGGQSAR